MTAAVGHLRKVQVINDWCSLGVRLTITFRPRSGARQAWRRSAPAVRCRRGRGAHTEQLHAAGVNRRIARPMTASRLSILMARFPVWVVRRPTSLRIHRRKAVSEISLPEDGHSSPGNSDPLQPFKASPFRRQLSTISRHPAPCPARFPPLAHVLASGYRSRQRCDGIQRSS